MIHPFRDFLIRDPHYFVILFQTFLKKFGGSEKGRSLISAYQSLAITTDTPGFEKLNTALLTCSWHQEKRNNDFTNLYCKKTQQAF